MHMQGRRVLKLSQTTALGLFDLQHFELVRCTAANVKCLVAWSDESLVVAFRGTANFSNIVADIRVGPVTVSLSDLGHAFVTSACKICFTVLT